MTLVELIEMVSKNTGHTKKESEIVIRNFLDATFATLITCESVKLSGYGSFYVAELKPRKYFGKSNMSEPRYRIRFKASKKLRRSKPWKSTQSN